jgi:dimethylaniline monooxygenase (N-oxide forming)
LIILEADVHIGGPWAARELIPPQALVTNSRLTTSDRSYDSFMTQTPIHFAGFSDKPLGVPKAELYYRHFPARYLTQYLEDYVDEHISDGATLRSRIQLGMRVERVSKVDGVWVVHTVNGKCFTAGKLVDAIGLTSEPSIPDIPGRETFRGLQIHHKDFGQSKLLDSSDIHNVVVLGGSKSAADVAYAAAKAGKKVQWIIRKSGTGPPWFVPVYGAGGMSSCSTDPLWTRLMTPLLGSIFAESGVVSRFLHSSWLGQFLFWRFWDLVTYALLYVTDYERADGRQNRFHNLKPDTAMFWSNESTSIDNKADFLDTIARNVQVLREDVVAIRESSVELCNGVQLEADALLYATGWRCDMSYFDHSLRVKLGLPMAEANLDDNYQQQWRTLDQQAEAKIDFEMPMLSRNEPYRKPNKQRTPMRLYKSMLPIEDRTMVLLGKTVIAHTFPAAEVAALWAVTALDGKIAFPSVETMREEVALVVVWSRRRYPSRGWQGMWLPWDLIPFTDMLLKQMGLVSHRGGTWWSDLTTPTSSRRLRGLIGEYKKKYGE